MDFLAQAPIDSDPIYSAIAKALASYIGIAGLVVGFVGGIKLVVKTWIDGKEPLVALCLTYLLGIAAKFALPAVYGPHTIERWAIHLVVLLGVAIGVKGIHDGVINPFKGKKEKEKDPS